jgi:hypothetical protein
MKCAVRADVFEEERRRASTHKAASRNLINHAGRFAAAPSLKTAGNG